MLLVSFILAGLVVVVTVIQLLGTSSYLSWFRSYKEPPHPESRLPSVAVVLALRGNDPSLNECLKRLAALDYPDYEIHLVIDDEADPAFDAAEAWMAEHQGAAVRIHILRDVSPHAYLKTSAIRQCLKEIGSSVGAAVMVDADTLVYPSWLHDLVHPMIGTDVGLVTGNRWYDPSRRKWGDRVRFLYNANSVMPMYFMKATWGGSLALRREVFDQQYFFDRMWNTSSEDSAMQDAARRAGLKLRVTPSVMMFNGEETSLGDCFRFIRRQLLWTRLYHPNWNALFIGTVFSYLVLAASVILSAIAAWRGDLLAASVLALALIGILVANLWQSECLHNSIACRVQKRQGIEFPRFDWLVRLRLAVALPLTLIVYTFASIAAAFAREVRWRGVTYLVKPPRSLEMIAYQPFVTCSYPRSTSESIV